MGRYPRLKDGAILRARPDCPYPAEAAHVAVSPEGLVYLLTPEEYQLFAACDGTTPTEEMPELGVKVEADPDCLNFLELQDSPRAISQKQKVETLGLLTPCRNAIWHATRACNMACAHCYYLYEKNGRRDFDSKEKYSIATNLSRIGVETVRISGGEATLDADRFAILIEALTQECLPTIVNTNGWRHPERIIAAFNHNPFMRAVQVSLDGPKTAHEAIRGSASFNEIKANIIRFRSEGIHVRVISMLFDAWWQRHRIQEMCRHIAEMGVMDWAVEIPSMTGLWTKDLTLAQEQILVAANAFREFLESGAHQLTTFSLNQVFDWPPEENSPRSKTLADPICSHDLGLLSFGPEGIAFCTLFREQFGPNWKDIGNAQANDLKQVWNHIAAHRIGRTIGQNPACASCDMFPSCQGGCPGQYEDPLHLSGCDHHSRNLALVKQRLEKEAEKAGGGKHA